MKTNLPTWFSTEAILYSVYGESLPKSEVFRRFLHKATEEIVLPLVLNISNNLAKQSISIPFIQGVLGLQGTGKTTISELIVSALKFAGFTSFAVSIDDFYLPFSARQELRMREPRLRRRGPPGTHDMALINRFIKELDSGRGSSVQVPRFDKALHCGEGDQIDPILQTVPDVVIIEGWFLGARPADPHSHFASELTPLINEILPEYAPLWNRLDGLVGLFPAPFSLSKQWRIDAERALRTEKGSGMTEEQVEDFVDYFWQSLHPELYMSPLMSDANYLQGYVLIDANRNITEKHGIFM
jgi:D-glycerate 3-kinase